MSTTCCSNSHQRKQANPQSNFVPTLFHFNISSLQDLNTRKWKKPNATGSVPLGRRSHSAFVYNKQLYVFGGYNSIMEKHFNDLYCYNPAMNRWNVVAARGVPPRPRRRQVCLVIDKRMYLFGGTR